LFICIASGSITQQSVYNFLLVQALVM
jgi:hypothetical protein